MIDNPAGPKPGFYRVGKRLDTNGNVQGGWGPWIPIPDWFSGKTSTAQSRWRIWMETATSS